MKYLKTMFALPLALCVAFATTSAYSQGDKDEVVGIEVTGIGEGCDVDKDGEMKDWNWKWMKASKILRVTFDEFFVEEDGSNVSSCTLDITVETKGNKTLYMKNALIQGEATIERGEKVYIESALQYDGKKPIKNVKKLTDKDSGGWSTPSYEYAKPDRPCGNTEEEFEYHLKIKRKGGKKSEVEITSKESRFTEFLLDFGDCK